MRRICTVGKAANLGPGAAPQYDIAVFVSLEEKRWYRTQRLVSNIGAEAARGRGTRVWEVALLNERNEPVGRPRVLKDCWIDDDRTREGEILRQIRLSARTEEHERAFRDYLLTVECHGDVFIGGQKDQTHSLIRRGHAVPQNHAWYELRSSPPSPNADAPLYPSGSIPFLAPIVDREIIEYDDKSHYRIVFEELGTSIDKLNSTFDIVYNLGLALEGAYPSNTPSTGYKIDVCSILRVPSVAPMRLGSPRRQHG